MTPIASAATMPDGGEPQIPRYLPELDGLRTIAAVLVVLRHWVDLPMDGSLLQRALVGVSRLGWVGVDLFFVLSGFLITGILVDSKGEKNYFRSFWGRRILRIFPLYYLVIAFWLLLVPQFSIFGQWKYFWGNATHGWEWTLWVFGSNYTYGFGYLAHQFLVVTWSLCIEEHFYLIWPLIVYRYAPRTLLWISGGVAAVSFLSRIFVLLGTGGDPYLVSFSTASHLDGLALGSLLALLVRRGPDAAANLWQRGRILLLPAATGAAIIGWMDNTQSFDRSRFLGQSATVVTFGILIFSLFFTLVLLSVVAASPGSRWRKFLRWGPLVWTGKLTFSIYLLHLPVHFFVQLWVRTLIHPEQELGWRWLAAQMISFAVLIPVCLLVWCLWERPFLSLKRYFPRPGEQDIVKAPAVKATQQSLAVPSVP